MYGQDKVFGIFHENAAKGRKVIEDAEKLAQAGVAMPYTASYSWFVEMTETEWDYKVNPEWQVKGKMVNGKELFNGGNLDEDNNRNWRPWIYFDGELWGADKIGNMNLGYVGTEMGFEGKLISNFATMDKDDGPAVRRGISLAKTGM
jgi:hypothetical protein